MPSAKWLAFQFGDLFSTELGGGLGLALSKASTQIESTTPHLCQTRGCWGGGQLRELSTPGARGVRKPTTDTHDGWPRGTPAPVPQGAVLWLPAHELVIAMWPLEARTLQAAICLARNASMWWIEPAGGTGIPSTVTTAVMAQRGPDPHTPRVVSCRQTALPTVWPDT